MLIYDEDGNERMTFVGPYLEGEDARLTCRAFGGKHTHTHTSLKLSQTHKYEIDSFFTNLVCQFLHLITEQVF